MFMILVLILCLLSTGSPFLGPVKVDTQITSCVEITIHRLFPNETTLYFISSTTESSLILPQINNPRIVVNVDETIALSSYIFNSYIIYSNDYFYLKQTLNILKRSSIWNMSESPRGRFLLLTSPNNSPKETFETLWGFDIINVILIVPQNNAAPIVYTSNPFAKENKCGHEAKIVFDQSCTAKTSIRFNKTIKNLHGCSLKVDSALPKTKFRQSVGRALMYRILVFVGKILQADQVEGFTFKNEKAEHYNYSEGILISLGITRGLELLEYYDLSMILFRDVFIWAVPKPDKIYDISIIAKLYKKNVWILIGISLIVVILTWWLMAKYSDDRKGFQKFWRSFLAILAIALCGCDNLRPKTKTLKFIALFFSIYCIQINTSFNANLISVLTQPFYSQSITTMEELAESGLPLLIQSSIVLDKVNLSSSYGRIFFDKLQKQFIFTPTINSTDALRRIVLHRNLSALMAKGAIKASGGYNVDVVEADLLRMEATYCLRKGHYFLPTFNKIVTLMYEYGFHEKILREAETKSDNAEDYSNTVLSVKHLSSIFVCWGIGLALATVVFLIES